ncbi:hypothetical protein ACQR16_17820 [Bradyrhizobium oligotrophicum]|uniref:hypothetical protein n=1 Tax=Bradyrhizobium oligotrophicum TaxID=44255 RepID=UPI003EC0AE98
MQRKIGRVSNDHFPNACSLRVARTWRHQIQVNKMADQLASRREYMDASRSTTNQARGPLLRKAGAQHQVPERRASLPSGQQMRIMMTSPSAALADAVRDPMSLHAITPRVAAAWLVTP